MNWIKVSEEKPPVDIRANDGCSALVLVAHESGSWGSAWYDFGDEKWHACDDDSLVTHWMAVTLP